MQSHTATIRPVLIHKLTDALCVDEVDVIIIECGDYVNTANRLRAANSKLRNVPFLLFLYLDKRPQDPNVAYVFSKESTPDILVTLVKTLYIASNKKSAERLMQIQSCKNKPTMKELKEKYLPQLLKIKEELQNSRGINR